jgi:hypothetical protein
MAWRGGALVVAVAAVFAAAAFAANPPGPPAIPADSTPTTTQATPGPDVTVASSSKQAGAHPVALTLSFAGTLVCGHVRGATTVTMPQAADVPSTLAAVDVTINGKRAGKVSVHDSTITVMPPAVTGMSCHSIVLGTVHLGFTRAAGIGNPSTGGTYAVVVHRGGQVLRGTLTIVG